MIIDIHAHIFPDKIAEKATAGIDCSSSLYPMWTPTEELERFNRILLTDEEREMILWKNAYNLLS